jgi:hypothetical protein
MSRQYSPKRFFRQAANRFLQQYFAIRGIPIDVDLASLSETHIEPLYEAWLALPEGDRKRTEQDFREIDELACVGGSKAILDEAKWHGEELSETFAALSGFHDHAFWTFLERPGYWRGAAAFHHADTIPSSYWRKRKNLPRKPANIDASSIRTFEQKIGECFHVIQGRGRNCKVDYYKRDNFDYFFAFPEDYAQANIEWEEQEFKRRPYHPAFEVIFVFSQDDGTLDIYLPGERKLVTDLQTIFAEVILNAELKPDQKDERVYDLNPLRSRHFQFVYGPESNIESVVVRKLRLSIYGKKEKVTVEADPSQHKHAVYDLLIKATKELSPSEFSISQVGIKVTFAQNPASRKPQTRSFDITWPNSCSLRHDGRDLYIRKMLVDSGIEPKAPVKDGTVS